MFGCSRELGIVAALKSDANATTCGLPLFFSLYHGVARP